MGGSKEEGKKKRHDDQNKRHDDKKKRHDDQRKLTSEGKAGNSSMTAGSSKATKRKREVNASRVILPKRSRSENTSGGHRSLEESLLEPRSVNERRSRGERTMERVPLNFKFIIQEYKDLHNIDGLDYERALTAVTKMLGSRKNQIPLWKFIPVIPAKQGLPPQLQASEGGLHWAHVTQLYWENHDDEKREWIQRKLQTHNSYNSMKPDPNDDEATAKEKKNKRTAVIRGYFANFDEVVRRLFKLTKVKGIGAAFLVKLVEAIDRTKVYFLGDEILRDANNTFQKNWPVWCQNLSLDNEFKSHGYAFAVWGSDVMEEQQEYEDHLKDRARYVWKVVEEDYVKSLSSAAAEPGPSTKVETDLQETGSILSHQNDDEATVRLAPRTPGEESDEQRKWNMDMEAFKRTLVDITLEECESSREINNRKTRNLRTEIRKIDALIRQTTGELQLRKIMEVELVLKDAQLKNESKRKVRLGRACKDAQQAVKLSTECTNIITQAVENDKNEDDFYKSVLNLINKYKMNPANAIEKPGPSSALVGEKCDKRGDDGSEVDKTAVTKEGRTNEGGEEHNKTGENTEVQQTGQDEGNIISTQSGMNVESTIVTEEAVDSKTQKEDGNDDGSFHTGSPIKNDPFILTSQGIVDGKEVSDEAGGNETGQTDITKVAAVHEEASSSASGFQEYISKSNASAGFKQLVQSPAFIPIDMFAKGPAIAAGYNPWGPDSDEEESNVTSGVTEATKAPQEQGSEDGVEKVEGGIPKGKQIDDDSGIGGLNSVLNVTGDESDVRVRLEKATAASEAARKEAEN